MLSSIARLYFVCVFDFFVRIIKRNNPNIAIFDLDNTIYNTWIERLDPSATENQIYTKAKVFKRVAKKVIQHYQSNDVIVFLSSRRYGCYPITCRRVLTDFQFATMFSVILVAHPQEKLFFINRLLRLGRRITYYDDLAYGHETGTISFYTELINEITRLPLKYHGYQELSKLQNEDIDVN